MRRWPTSKRGHSEEYLASAGHPLWFAGHTPFAVQPASATVACVYAGKTAPADPGARHYVMPAAVGRRAGLDIVVGRVKSTSMRTPARQVNDDDWLRRDGQDSIAGILGGADNDDALWLFPFTDRRLTAQGVGLALP